MPPFWNEDIIKHQIRHLYEYLGIERNLFLGIYAHLFQKICARVLRLACNQIEENKWARFDNHQQSHILSVDGASPYLEETIIHEVAAQEKYLLTGS